MFNEELKKRFLRECGFNDRYSAEFISLFGKSEPFEKEYGYDLCTFSTSELQLFCDQSLGMRQSSRANALTRLSRYINWAVESGVSGAENNLRYVSIDETNKFRDRMVSSPSHLSDILDKIFRHDDDCTTDIIYKSVYWMAFSGIECDAIKSMTEDMVDFNNMVVFLNGKEYQIYEESKDTLLSCKEIKQFRLYHPTFREKYVWRDRASGDLLFRGIDGQDGISFLLTNASRKVKSANKNGIVSCRFTYETLRLSGLFFRLYELEKMGVNPDFRWVAENVMHGREYKATKDHTMNSKVTRIATAYKKDYESWKFAFQK